MREGDLLVVPVGARLPKVCLKCGARHDITRRKASFTIGTAAKAAGTASGVGGAVLAQALRGLDRTFAVLAFTGVAGMLGVIAWLAQRGAAKVELALPLCASCDAAWTEGEMLRTRFAWALGVSFALLAAGYALYSTPTLGVGGALFVLALVMAIGARLPKRFVSATVAKAEAVSLKVEGAIADDVVARARRRAERRDAQRDEGPDEET